MVARNDQVANLRPQRGVELRCGIRLWRGQAREFTFDVADRTIRLDYNERYTASVNYSHEF